MTRENKLDEAAEEIINYISGEDKTVDGGEILIVSFSFSSQISHQAEPGRRATLF